MKKRFFKPFIGEYYQDGIKGKKVLVTGASFYCNKTKCPFYPECTNVNIKDSSKFDYICPEYANGSALNNEPSNCIEEQNKTYQTFESTLRAIIDTNNYDETWSRVAFTNYVHFFLPAEEDKSRETKKSDLSQRDFDAFIETLLELKPNVVIVWGCVINTSLKENNPYLISIKELKDNEDYLCYIQVPGIKHKIAIVNSFHPSSGHWHGDISSFEKYLKKALEE